MDLFELNEAFAAQAIAVLRYKIGCRDRKKFYVFTNCLSDNQRCGSAPFTLLVYM